MAEADLVILNTCHIREKAAEKVYSELGRVRAEARAGGRGPRDDGSSSPAASPRPRAARSCAARRPSTSSSGRRAYHRLPELLAKARTGRPRRRHRIPGRGQVRPPAAAPARTGPAAAASRPSSPSRKAATSSAPSASCPIRAAPRSRGRWRRIVEEAQRLAAAGVREITLIGQNVNAYHGEGPDGTTWALGGLLRRLAEIAGHRAAALHDEPPARHGRRPDRGPPRPARADALPAPAGAVGLRPHPRGHEPQAHGRTTTARLIDRIRAARPDIALSSDFIVGFPGETEADFARDACGSSRDVGFAERLLVQVQPAPGHARGGDAPDQVPERGQGGAAGAAAGAAREAAPGLQPRHRRAARSTFSSRSRAGIRARWPASRPISRPCRSKAGVSDRRRSCRCGSSGRARTACSARRPGPARAAA